MAKKTYMGIGIALGTAIGVALGVAMDNLALGIGAILKQGKGEPYTAFARMAAMAAVVAQFVGGISSISGGFIGCAVSHPLTTQ